jgi:hypothetical protein
MLAASSARWGFYQIFTGIYDEVNRRKPVAVFIGRQIAQQTYFQGADTLYRDQDGYLYFCTDSYESLPRRGQRWKDCWWIDCYWWMRARDYQGLRDHFRDFGPGELGIDPMDGIPSILCEPPEIETMHELSGYDS